ncbi:MAG TPA: sugar ABC transporter substrate-binding protein [Candidatus Dormibacteraeota bacterium]|jgi:simple sugar transport system substrate-binding protein|nr:sugar ABC transporter substrate-binding protein [Candidatus Dormibacteraeota bacterium]MDQ6790000.1 sugar ABC transporter substrate-binding protein [Candidatus Dormibacteraeota bacterium]
MFGSGKRTVRLALVAVLGLVAAACSASGGQQSTNSASTQTHFKFAMVTHAPAGDTFFDIIRKGASAAAAKDNVSYTYSNDGDPTKQSVLIQSAIDSKVEGIAVADPAPAALNPVIKKAVDAGIPVVMFNAGFNNWPDSGALMYFGQDESLAGQQAGARLTQEGAKHVLCVEQAQGQVQLEARCNGVAQGFTAGSTEKLYVNGTDPTAVRTTISAKLQQDKSIDYIITLGAPIALVAVQAIKDAGSSSKLVTFDTNAALVSAVQSGQVLWAVDQQPFLQGYEAIDALWLYKTNRNLLGGGRAVLTGPSFIDKNNIAAVAGLAKAGTR